MMRTRVFRDGSEIELHVHCVGRLLEGSFQIGDISAREMHAPEELLRRIAELL